jgi:hypothetical protein
MQPHNPYAPPQAQPGFPQYAQAGFGQGQWPTQAYMDGATLAIPRGFGFPDVCLKCGAAHAATRRNQKYQWSPPWAYALFALGWLFGLIAVMVTRKTSQHMLPLCIPCNDQWKKGRLAFGLSFLPGLLFMLIAGLVASQSSDATGVLIIISVLSFIAGPLVAHFAFARPRTVYVQRIDDRYSYLLGFHPQAALAACSPALPPGPGQPYGQPQLPHGYPSYGQPGSNGGYPPR